MLARRLAAAAATAATALLLLVTATTTTTTTTASPVTLRIKTAFPDVATPGFRLSTQLAHQAAASAEALFSGGPPDADSSSPDDSTTLQDRVRDMVLDLTNQDQPHAELAASILAAFPGLVDDFADAKGVMTATVYGDELTPSYVVRRAKLDMADAVHSGDWCDVVVTEPLASTLQPGPLTGVSGFVMDSEDGGPSDDCPDCPACVMVLTSASASRTSTSTSTTTGTKRVRVVVTTDSPFTKRDLEKTVLPRVARAFADVSLGKFTLQLSLDVRSNPSAPTDAKVVQDPSLIGHDASSSSFWSTVVVSGDQGWARVTATLGGSLTWVRLPPTASSDLATAAFVFGLTHNLGVGLSETADVMDPRGGVFAGAAPARLNATATSTSSGADSTKRAVLDVAHRVALGWLPPAALTRFDVTPNVRLDATLVMRPVPYGRSTSFDAPTPNTEAYGVSVPYALGSLVAELTPDGTGVVVRRLRRSSDVASASSLAGVLRPGDASVSGPVSLSVATATQQGKKVLLLRVTANVCSAPPECVMPTPLVTTATEGDSAATAGASFHGCVDGARLAVANISAGLGWCFVPDGTTRACTCLPSSPAAAAAGQPQPQQQGNTNSQNKNRPSADATLNDNDDALKALFAVPGDTTPGVSTTQTEGVSNGGGSGSGSGSSSESSNTAATAVPVAVGGALVVAGVVALVVALVLRNRRARSPTIPRRISIERVPSNSSDFLFKRRPGPSSVKSKSSEGEPNEEEEGPRRSLPSGSATVGGRPLFSPTVRALLPSGSSIMSTGSDGGSTFDLDFPRASTPRHALPTPPPEVTPAMGTASGRPPLPPKDARRVKGLYRRATSSSSSKESSSDGSVEMANV